MLPSALLSASTSRSRPLGSTSIWKVKYLKVLLQPLAVYYYFLVKYIFDHAHSLLRVRNASSHQVQESTSPFVFCPSQPSWPCFTTIQGLHAFGSPQPLSSVKSKPLSFFIEIQPLWKPVLPRLGKSKIHPVSQCGYDLFK